MFFSAKDGTLKIGDFGLSTNIKHYGRISQQGAKSLNYIKFEHTEDIGTELYMSPEQLAQKKYNHKVDIFALGIIFFEILTPFHTTMERFVTLQKLKNSEFPANWDGTKKARKLINCMLEKNPEDRPEAHQIRYMRQDIFPN